MEKLRLLILAIIAIAGYLLATAGYQLYRQNTSGIYFLINAAHPREFSLAEISPEIRPAAPNQVMSVFELEFISRKMWDEAIRRNEFISFEVKRAKTSSGPLILSLDTLEQPIRENISFYIGIMISQTSNETNITTIHELVLELPKELHENKFRCVPSEPKATMEDKADSVSWIWKNFSDRR